jgi:hypothetical protein
MSFMNSRKFYYPLETVALLGQLLGLVFCGDVVDCLQGGSDENCATLICGLLAKHAATEPKPTSDNGLDNSCQRFCHVLIDIPETTLYLAPLVAMPHNTSKVLHFFPEPIRNIDHPPRLDSVLTDFPIL